MDLHPNDEYGAATDRGEAPESRWFTETPIRRLLGHVMLTLLLATLVFAGITLVL